MFFDNSTFRHFVIRFNLQILVTKFFHNVSSLVHSCDYYFFYIVLIPPIFSPIQPIFFTNPTNFFTTPTNFFTNPNNLFHQVNQFVSPFQPIFFTHQQFWFLAHLKGQIQKVIYRQQVFQKLNSKIVSKICPGFGFKFR